LNEKKKGSYNARNCGALQAKGSIIVFTDADCIVDKNWLRNIKAAFDDPKIGAVAGNIRGHKPEGIVEIFHSLFTLKTSPQDNLFKSFSLTEGGFPTANIAVKKDLFLKLGGFDSTRLSGADYDFCNRVYREECYIRYISSGIVYHVHRNDITNTYRQAFKFGESHAYLLSKIFQRYLLVEFLGVHFQTNKLSVKAWINLSSADKKLLLILVLSLVYLPFSVLIPIYLICLFHDISVRVKAENLNVNFLGNISIIGLLIIKSAGITLGRLWGAAKHGVICI